jgi:hypothetical protein
MERAAVDDLLGSLMEELAAIEHERWSHWQGYMYGKSLRQPDGSLVLPSELVSQWEMQMTTKYEGLDDKEKESDREQVRRYLPLIASAIANEGLS